MFAVFSPWEFNLSIAQKSSFLSCALHGTYYILASVVYWVQLLPTVLLLSTGDKNSENNFEYINL